MKCFETYAPEMKVYQDRVSGVTVRKLTDYYCDSYHAYFTNNGFYDNNKRLLFNSDRKNVANLYTIELESGEISRLTDFKSGDHVPTKFVNDINPVRPEIYYFRGDQLFAYDFENLESRFLYEAPKGFNMSGGLVNADGKYTYVLLKEDLSDRIYTNLGASYVGFAETWHARPLCKIARIDTLTGIPEIVWEEECWVGHINPSPTQPSFITFCHEGPWHLVDQRMWFMNTDTGHIHALRPRMVPGEALGHEYWYADGLKVGYQVHTPGVGSFNGVIDWDGKNQYEAPCVKYPGPDHIHSIDFNLIVSDSGKTIKLYRYNGTDFDEARILCMHDGSFFHQNHHPHPKVTIDNKVLFNSNESGYDQIYLADIPEDVLSLPTVPKDEQ